MDGYEEGEFCFAFHIQNEEYIKTGLVPDAGGGATLVDRRNGKIIAMGFSGSMENYEKRGDPHDGLSNVLKISGSYEDGQGQACSDYFCEVTGKSISETKSLIDTVLAGEDFIFDTKSLCEKEILDYIRGFERGFETFGFSVHRYTSREGYPNVTGDWLYDKSGE